MNCLVLFSLSWHLLSLEEGIMFEKNALAFGLKLFYVLLQTHLRFK